MTTEIDLYSRINDPISAIEKMGQWFAKSGMFGCDRAEQGQVLAMECLATNKPPSVIARTYHVMDGKLSKKALAALAEFRAAGGKHRWLKTGADGKEAELELTLDGNSITSRFTIEEARAQGLIRAKSAWEKTPGNMLRARAISNGVAMLAPEIFAGDVDDEVAPLPSTGPLLKEQPPAAVEQSPASKQEAVDVEVAPDSSPEPTAEKNGDGISAATQKAIVDYVGSENSDALTLWLVKQGWLMRDQNLSALRVDRAQKLLNAKRELVLQKIKGT